MTKSLSKILTYKKGFVGSVVAYTFWGALDKIIPFVLLPVFTRMFSPEDIGYYTLYQTLMILIPPLLTCDVDTSISINYFHYDREKLSSMIYSSVLYVLAVYIVVLIICIIGNDTITRLIKFPFREFVVLVTNCFFFLHLSILLCIFRNENKVFFYGLFSFLKTIISYGISLYLIFIKSSSWKGIIYGDFVSGIVLFLICLIVLRKKRFISNPFSSLLLKDSLRTGFPAALHNIGTWLSNSFNQFLVNILIGIAATGQYGVGATYGMIVSFIHTSINKAYAPYVFSCIKNKNLSIVQNLIRKLYVLIIGLFFVVIIIGYTCNDFIFGESYSGVKRFIAPLVLSSTMWGLYKIHVTFLFYYKQVWSITKITVVTGLINIPISYLLISTFGIMGAALAAAGSSIIIYVLVYMSSKRALAKYYEN